MMKVSPKVIIGILIGVCFAAAFFFRVYFPYDQIFQGDWIKFSSNDAYFHMRLVDNLLHNFPHMTSFDPYFLYPHDSGVGSIYFFDWFLASIIWVIGLGSPSQHMIDVIGAYFPVILASLTVIPVYFIGKALFNKWVGLISAALLAVLPGEYMGRSILGFTDQHVAETFFSTIGVLFVILAVKTARQRGLTYSHLISRDWKLSTRPLIYALLSGIFLGLYLITWAGALLFVFIIALYLVIQFIIDHLRRQSTDYLAIPGIILFLIALIIFIPFSPSALYTVSLIMAVLIVVVLSSISRLMVNRGIRAAYYPLFLIGLGIVGLAVFYAVTSDLLKSMFSLFNVFVPGGGAMAATTMEMQPFLSPQGSFSTAVAWGNYTTGFYISLCVLLYLIFYRAIYRRQSDSGEILFIIWSVIILIATLTQRRFAYYFVVNVALLTAHFSWQVIWYAGLRKLATSRQKAEAELEVNTKHGKKEKLKKRDGFTIYHINVILASIVLFFFVLFPNTIKSREVASQAPFAPTDGWQSALLWLKDNSPEPFGDSDAYYRLSEKPAREHSAAFVPGASIDELLNWIEQEKQGYDYPPSVYGVMSWWDYGYWIERIAHRIPNANPGQPTVPITLIANAFLSDDDNLVREITKGLDSSYIIADYSMSTSKFWAIVTWSGQNVPEFIGIYYVAQADELIPVQVYNPEYYHSLMVRLYNFDGKAVTEAAPAVISYENKTDTKGNHYRQITNIEQFTSYQEALDYVESKGPDNNKIIGVDPFTSPVPLEAVKDYNLIYSSEYSMSHSEEKIIPEVKIFQYVGGG